MPLRGFVNDSNVLAPLLNDEEWDRLKKAVSSRQSSVRLPCCKTEARLRKSKLGTKHFFHKPNIECEWKGESFQHLRAKNDIVIACQNTGYQAVPEFASEGWRADVLAVKSSRTIAFEVQWSAQTLEETKRRQKRYKKDGITGVWLFRRMPRQIDEPDRNLPIFQIQMDSSNEIQVLLNGNVWPLVSFIESLLSGRIKHCRQMSSNRQQLVRIGFAEVDCWKRQCKKRSHIYQVKDPYFSSCLLEMPENNTLWSSCKAEFRPEIMALVQSFLKTKRFAQIKVGAIKKRYSRMAGTSYTSFGCYWCDALFGDGFLMDGMMVARFDNASPLTGSIRPKDPIITEWSHWCFPEDGSFCER